MLHRIATVPVRRSNMCQSILTIKQRSSLGFMLFVNKLWQSSRGSARSSIGGGMSFVPRTLSVTAPLSTSVPTFGNAPVYDLVRQDLRQNVHVLRSSTSESLEGYLPRKSPLVLGSGVVCISVQAVRISCNDLGWNIATTHEQPAKAVVSKVHLI